MGLLELVGGCRSMISLVLASVLVAAAPAPAGATPSAPSSAAPSSAPPSPPPPSADSLPAAAPAPPAAPAQQPSIDSILQSLSAPGQATDGEEDADQAPPAAPGPTPYQQLDVKAYDQAIRETAAAARARGGPLQGGWTLAGADGQALYRFQFADQGLGLGLAEGAWRDLNGGPRLEGSGFIELVGYDGDKLMLRFYESGPDDPVLVTVKPSATGAWSGQLQRKGSATPVSFKRD